MANLDPRLGYTNEQGEQVFPETTLGGFPYYRSNTPAQRGLGGGFFVVLDPFPVVGLDVEATIEELRAKVAPTPAVTEEQPTIHEETTDAS